MKTKPAIAPLIVITIAMLTSPRLQAADKSGPESVSIDNFNFTPPILTVQVGATVTWINKDDVPHTVTSNDRKFKSPVLDTGEKFSHTFSMAGTNDYYCSVHSHMTGRIIVR